jgi:hypothetical protein
MVNSTAFDSELTKNQTLSELQQCKLPTDSLDNVESELGYHGSLQWSKADQAYLFSSLFYGSLITVGFSGTIADSFDPKLLILLSSIVYTM